MPTKHNATGRRKNGGRFILVDHVLFDSPAYRSLSCTARALLYEMNRFYNGSNNGEIFMSQRMAAERLGLKTHRTAAKALRELEDRSFIRTRVKGSFTRKTLHASTFVLTNQELNGQPASRDFMRWEPRAEKKPRVQKRSRPGAKKKPTVPQGWPDGCDFSPDMAGSDHAAGGNIGSTYNIPREGELAAEIEAPQVPAKAA